MCVCECGWTLACLTLKKLFENTFICCCRFVSSMNVNSNDMTHVRSIFNTFVEPMVSHSHFLQLG